MRVSLHLALLALAASIGSLSARADEVAGESPVLRQTLVSGVYALEGGFEVNAPTHLVWQVLTDFDGLPRFVHSMRTSVAEALGDGGLLVEQVFQGKVLIFSRDLRVRLVINERPEQRINFRDVALRDFDVYEGSWQLEESPAGSKVTYVLRAKPHDSVPDFLGRGAFMESATQMLAQLRDEIVRRTAKRPLTQTDVTGQEGRAP